MTFSKELEDFNFMKLACSAHNYELDDFPELCSPSAIKPNSVRVVPCTDTARYVFVETVDARRRHRKQLEAGYDKNLADLKQYLRTEVSEEIEKRMQVLKISINRMLCMINALKYAHLIENMHEVVMIKDFPNSFSVARIEKSYKVDDYIDPTRYTEALYFNTESEMRGLADMIGEDIVNRIVNDIPKIIQCNAVINRCNAICGIINRANAQYLRICAYSTRQATTEYCIRRLRKYDLATYANSDDYSKIDIISAVNLYRLGAIQNATVNGINYGDPVTTMAVYSAVLMFIQDTKTDCSIKLDIMFNKCRLDAIIKDMEKS